MAEPPSSRPTEPRAGRPLRILVVSQYFWPEEFRVNDLALELADRGHEVTVLTGQPSFPSRALFGGYGPFRPWTERLGRVAVKRVPLASRGRGQGWRLALNYLSFAASASLLGPARLRGRFDVIFVYQPSPVTVGVPAAVLRRLKGVPIVFWVQDLWPESLAATGAVTSERVLRWVGRLVRWLYQQSDCVLMTSRGFLDHVAALGARPSKVAYFPQWAESAYAPVRLDEDAPERRELPGGFRVVLAGNIGTAQSLGTVLDAAGRLRDLDDVNWVIIGDGRQRAWVEAEVARRGLAGRVHLLGRRPVEAMPRYLSLADALVVALERREIYALTIPARLQSFLACGKPVLGALDGEGARVIEESGAGIAVPAEDAVALAGAVRCLYHLPAAERAAMGARGRAYFLEHFERQKLLDQLEACMRETAGGPEAAGSAARPVRVEAGRPIGTAGATPGVREQEARR
ncbi:MAG TPA: glycosyltransferase family 4 protein [Actinomycetes bacterium]|jgi:glycosyltransferase involved in cell wall biosynthesis|nr:glycosyltransferase family 4 protein [Actinomycetes bacterium]